MCWPDLSMQNVSHGGACFSSRSLYVSSDSQACHDASSFHYFKDASFDDIHDSTGQQSNHVGRICGQIPPAEISMHTNKLETDLNSCFV